LHSRTCKNAMSLAVRSCDNAARRAVAGRSTQEAVGSHVDRGGVTWSPRARCSDPISRQNGDPVVYPGASRSPSHPDDMGATVTRFFETMTFDSLRRPGLARGGPSGVTWYHARVVIAQSLDLIGAEAPRPAARRNRTEDAHRSPAMRDWSGPNSIRSSARAITSRRSAHSSALPVASWEGAEIAASIGHTASWKAANREQRNRCSPATKAAFNPALSPKRLGET
jgi:hypothetical protein